MAEVPDKPVEPPKVVTEPPKHVVGPEPPKHVIEPPKSKEVLAKEAAAKKEAEEAEKLERERLEQIEKMEAECAKILKEYGGMESNIPVNSAYWDIRNAVRAARVTY